MHAIHMDDTAAVCSNIFYLKGALTRGVLSLCHGLLDAEVYADADWVRSKIVRRSTIRCLTLIGGNLVSLKSKKHVVVA